MAAEREPDAAPGDLRGEDGVETRPLTWGQVNQDYPAFIKWARTVNPDVNIQGAFSIDLYNQLKAGYNAYIEALKVP
jgi:hypothetical protein